MQTTCKTHCSYLFLLSFCFLSGLGAQTLPLQVLPKKARALLEDYVLIPGGMFVNNIYTGYDSLQFRFPETVSVDSFYMSRYEVTVGEYVRFFQESGDIRNQYDSLVWLKDLPVPTNEPVFRNYFRGEFFQVYPIVGITWDQAMRFCQWKSEAINGLLKNTGYVVEFTLPTDSEWQYAACGPPDDDLTNFEHRIFPWGFYFLFPHSGNEGCRLRCNSGPSLTPQGFKVLDYADDGGLYTLPVESYEPNSFGLYQMAGNVAEWTSENYSVDYAKAEEAKRRFQDSPETEKRYTPVFPAGTYDDYKIVKGGSWADQPFYMQIGVLKIQHPETASRTVGFRPVFRIYRK